MGILQPVRSIQEHSALVPFILTSSVADVNTIAADYLVLCTPFFCRLVLLLLSVLLCLMEFFSLVVCDPLHLPTWQERIPYHCYACTFICRLFLRVVC
jgi:hypothetical protein